MEDLEQRIKNRLDSLYSFEKPTIQRAGFIGGLFGVAPPLLGTTLLETSAQFSEIYQSLYNSLPLNLAYNSVIFTLCLLGFTTGQYIGKAIGLCRLPEQYSRI